MAENLFLNKVSCQKYIANNEKNDHKSMLFTFSITITVNRITIRIDIIYDLFFFF